MTDRKVALVTAGTKGIGRAIARRLAGSDIRVVVNYLRDADGAADVVTGIEQAGGAAIAVHGDVTDAAAVRALFDAAEQHFGGLDIVVGNASSWMHSPLAQSSDDDFDRVFAANTRGAFLTLREAANRVRPGGRIVMISSGVTRLSPLGLGLYSASKSAIEQWVRTLAKELGDRQVTVNGVAPGGTLTEGLAAATGHSPEALQALVEQITATTPLGRIGEPDDIADVVAFLTSENARWVTGQVIAAGGGSF